MWFALGALLACAIATFYIFVKQCQSYWEKRGVPFDKPMFFFGSMLNTTLGRETLFQTITKIYNKFPDCKYVGFYKFLANAVIIQDPDLLNEMLVKDFQHFSDNEIVVDEKVDYIMSKNLFVLKGHKWKSTRSLLSPMFSSGKLKYVFPLSKEVSERMTNYLKREIESNRGKCIDGNTLCQRFTIDNVASCAFGLDAKAFEGETKFTMIVKGFNDASYINAIKFLLIFMFPKLNNYLKIKFFKDEVETYLTGVVGETLRYRKENNIKRNDFLDQIASLREKSMEFPFTDRDIVAQGAGFFIDGVGTSSGFASYVLTEIGLHPEVQKKVRDEIKKVKAAHGGELTYEGLSEMTYLECVINETLRMDNPVGGMLKVCTKTYTLPEVSETNKTRLVLNPGDAVMAPVDGFNFNPNYFPDPHKFKPERFLDKNKDDLIKNTFIPFGMGPRHCIGMRFALLQIKMIVVSTIECYQLDINEKMLPLEVHPTAFLKAPLKGFWFDFSKLPE